MAGILTPTPAGRGRFDEDFDTSDTLDFFNVGSNDWYDIQGTVALQLTVWDQLRELLDYGPRLPPAVGLAARLGRVDVVAVRGGFEAALRP